MLLFLLQRGNLVDPPFHNRGAAAAALDEIVGLFLIQRNFLLDGGIKFLRHFVALLGIVDDVEAVDAQSIVVLILCTELLNERLERIDLIHVLPRDEIQMPGRADLGGLQHPQIAQTDRLDLSPICARLIELKQLLRPAAIVQRVNVGIEADVIIPKPIVAPVVKDVCQLFILVCPLVECFLDQLAGIDVLGVRVVAAVDRVDMMLTGILYRDPILDIARRGAERIRYGNSLAAGVRDVQLLTELRQRLLLHQNVGKREIEEFAQHGGLVAVGCTNDVLKIRNVCHNMSFLSRLSFCPVQQVIVHALESRVPCTLIVPDARNRLHLAAQGGDRLPNLRICKLIHVHRLHDLRDAERQERFPQSLVGIHAAEAHKKCVICKIACNIALERPLCEIGTLLRGVAGDVDPRVAACTLFHAAWPAGQPAVFSHRVVIQPNFHTLDQAVLVPHRNEKPVCASQRPCPVLCVKAGQPVQFMIAPEKRRQQTSFGFCFRHGLITVPLNDCIRKSSFMEVFSVPIRERQKRQHLRICRMALLQRIRFPARCVWGAGLQGQLIHVALCSQLQVCFFVCQTIQPRIQRHAVAARAAEVAAVLIGSRVQTQMIFAGSVVTAKGAACLNFLTVKRSVIEDKPAPPGGFQDQQLLISQTARPLSAI